MLSRHYQATKGQRNNVVGFIELNFEGETKQIATHSFSFNKNKYSLKSNHVMLNNAIGFHKITLKPVSFYFQYQMEI